MPRRNPEDRKQSASRRSSSASRKRARTGSSSASSKKDASFSIRDKIGKAAKSAQEKNTNTIKTGFEASAEKKAVTSKPESSIYLNNDKEKNVYLKKPHKATHAKSVFKKDKLTKQKKPLSAKIKKNKVSAEIRNNFIKLGAMILVGVGIIIGIYFGVQAILQKQSGFTAVSKADEIVPVNTQIPQERNTLDEASVTESEATADPAVVRDISYGARDIEFKEKQINIPGIFDNELLFSAGTGSLYVGGNVLSNLYLYNLDAGDETLIAESDIYAGEFYETLVNHKWLVWLETDHGTKNYIMVMDRSTGKVSKLQSFKEGQPKLNLYGDLLVWMEQVSDTEDRLSMIDLEVQEFLPIHTFTDKATYGVSAPCVYENTIVWADRDPTQTEEQKAEGENSAIYYLNLETDETGSFAEPEYYCPGTYVHEPLYNGDVFIWLDSNKSPRSNLYIGRPGEAAEIIATGVTTYSIGDGIVVYGKDQAVWVYVIDTKELCRLTSPGEMGMLPAVTKRTVVWYNLSADSQKDVLRYKVLTDEELYPGGQS